ncbi:hypothetical protein CO230_08655 [Chryseobacterium sp. 6424]|uniref:hypothetical protein n=1 Tax=Chryseobacterium sp. 6424 TaxID=2039166 RepID=UPI000EFBD672|nr:hypothetical protein [Chryseobacterium sp. 6424]AYO58184.1 hypothetical protein CO230_08655 [Chryseobacterium sp. 6424]
MTELQKALSKLARRKVNTFPASVVSVDKDAGTCTVSDGELEYTDVQLSATVSDDRRFLLIPKLQSFVLVSPIQEDLNRLYVEMVSEIDEVIMRTEAAEFSFNDAGFLLKKQDETLKQLMTDLLQEIQKMKFTTNTGSTIALVNKPQFIEIETRFKDFLK